MADITRLVFARHVRAEPTSHILYYKGDRLLRNGRGLSFWFLPLGASIVEVPLDDREQPFLFQQRTSDFQEITIQGVVVYRVVSPVVVASRVDFSIDTRSGEHARAPLDRIARLVTEIAQGFAAGWVGRTTLRDVLATGLEVLERRILDGLAADSSITDMGLAIVSTRVTSVKPTPDMERALTMPTLESIQEEADKATLQRRAIAVENERAIQENELRSQIELARREEELVVQRGQNERTRAKEQAEKQRIEVEARVETLRLERDAEANGMDIYRDLPPGAQIGLAAREIAGKLSRIENINVSPDLLGPLLGRLVDANLNGVADAKTGR
jgi:regulator of protease activity HflC (stomatin/prohibitin superfamily)